MKLIEEVYRSFDAEGKHDNGKRLCFDVDYFLVVFITSNYVGNREMMVGCRKLGIPAFGQLLLPTRMIHAYLPVISPLIKRRYSLGFLIAWHSYVTAGAYSYMPLQ
jgi:hypothetical protein